MLTILKGLIIGLGKIIPGVSGSVLALSLGVYEKCIDIISNLKKELKYNIKFIFLLSIGILTGIVFGSKIIYFLLNKYYIPTMSLFIGLISGTIKTIFKKIKLKTKKNYISMIIPFILIYFISILSINKLDTSNYLVIIILGFIDAVTMIVPGVSGTAIFMILGVYNFILYLLSNVFNPLIIFFIIGLILGLILTSKIINYFFKNYSNDTYIVILSLLCSSIIILIKDTFFSGFNIFELLIGIILILIGYFLGNFFENI